MLQDIRVQRLKDFIEQSKDAGHKTVASLADTYDVNASHISQILGGHRAFGETAARNLEQSFGLPAFYFEGDVLADSRSDTAEIERFKTLALGESCQLNANTVALRVIGGWIYTTTHKTTIGAAETVTSSCFAPFTTQHELDGMVDALIAKPLI